MAEEGGGNKKQQVIGSFERFYANERVSNHRRAFVYRPDVKLELNDRSEYSGGLGKVNSHANRIEKERR